MMKYRRNGSVEVEWEKDNNCLVVGYLSEVDTSFSHAFGTHHELQYEVDHITVFVFISGTEYDITKALTEKELENFKDQILEYARNTHNLEVGA
jgi:hypothetical protein